jgi:hypothetical protein
VLDVDIHLPDHELQALLSKHCAKFGTVKFVRLLPLAKNKVHRFAFVEMSTETENIDLAAHHGGSLFGHQVVAFRLGRHQ